MIIRILSLFLVFCASNPALAQERVVPASNEQVQLSYAPVVKKTLPAVVNVYTRRTIARRSRSPFAGDPFFAPFFRDDFFGGRMREQVESSLGSGVIVDSDGLVVTNEHVIRGAEEITIGLADGREFEAELLISDSASDLALLKVDTDENLPYAALKPSEKLEVGDIVLAIGNPFGVGQTVTSGIVSAQGRSALDVNDFNFFIQTDAAINPGNSGGALVSLDGGVVGINTAIYSRSGGSLGLGFAIPSEMVASVIAAAKSGQTASGAIIRPWLGVGAQDITSDIAESLGLERPFGALIKQLHPASPLKKAGVKVGDVVLNVNGREIRDAAEMKFRMATVALGTSANVGISRKGKILTLSVMAMAPPEDPPRDEITLSGRHVLSGVTIANLNPALEVELGVTNVDGGIVVTKAPRGSYGSRVVRVGDILVEINGREIKAPKDVQRALKNAGERGVALVINSGGRLRQIVLR